MMYNLILDSLLKARPTPIFTIGQILGSIFLVSGCMVGFYFLFQVLAQEIGYLESGGVISILLVAIGLCFLFFRQKRKATLISDFAEESKNLLKKADLGNFLHGNMSKVLIFSFIIGAFLSQLMPAKSSTESKK